MTRERLAGKAKSVLSKVADADLDQRAIKAAADAGDTVALEVIDELGHNVGLAASWIINVLNPGMLIVSGGLAQLGDLLMNPLRAAAMANGLGQALAGVQIVRSELGQDAELRGAVLLALQQSETYYRVVFQS
jgi:predicted NBD/HSP70 family sugar kinase